MPISHSCAATVCGVAAVHTLSMNHEGKMYVANNVIDTCLSMNSTIGTVATFLANTFACAAN